MKTCLGLIFFVLLASLQDGNACLSGPKRVKVLTGTVGGKITMTCYFDYPGKNKIFCRDGCRDGHILLETTGAEAQRGRYSMRYMDWLQHISITPVYMTITNLTEADSGKYSCFSGSVSAPYETFDFELKVKDAPTTPPPRLFSTSAPPASTQETTPPPASATVKTNQQPEPTWTPHSSPTSNPPSSTLRTSFEEQDNEVHEKEREEDREIRPPPGESSLL